MMKLTSVGCKRRRRASQSIRAIFLLAIITLLIEANNSEQSPTVFVLETDADESSPVTTTLRPQVDDTNTRIVTDTDASTSGSKQQHTTSSNSRRLEETYPIQQHPKNIVRNTNPSHHASHTNQQRHHQPASSTTTTTTTTTRAPKTEERLLISITANDSDDDLPQRRPTSSYDAATQTQTQSQTTQHNKRKPSITISIQDANLSNKQQFVGGSSSSSSSNIGGGSAPAVIVRPSENGQSIVISTLGGGASIVDANGNSKPAIAILSPSSSLSQSDTLSSDYGQPINAPLNSYSSSTRRPPIASSDNVRPPVSTLVENEQPDSPLLQTQQRPPNRLPPVTSSLASSTSSSSSSLDDERPHQPLDASNQSDEPQQSNKQTSSEPKYPLNEKNCGLVHETRIVGGDEANPDDFLWMAAIIKSRPKDGDVRPFCGGSLITRRHVLTAAHCLENLAPRDVLVRLGSYDFDDSSASALSADLAIDQFRVPAQYSKKTHAADIAIMRLKTPLQATDNYKTVCMPQLRRSYVGVLGTVTGYGSQSQTFRRAAPKLRQVTVPIWENRKCSVVYKKNLTESFLCAGFEEGGKDACQGDSGGPLMTEGVNERMMVVGVVSHGIGCGSPGYPGVYTRTSTYLDWIEKNTRE